LGFDGRVGLDGGVSEPQLLSAYAGHWTGAGTGVTVIIPPPGTVGSGEVRGGAPATREFDLLDPVRLVDRVDAVVLSGGSAFGLAAADGVARFLGARGQGFATPLGPVPIVVGMSIFDGSVAALPPEPDVSAGDPTAAAAAGPGGTERPAAAGGAESRVAAGGTKSWIAAGGAESQVAAGGTDSRVAAGGTDSRVAAGGAESRVVANPAESRVAADGAEGRVEVGPPPDAAAGRAAAIAALSGAPLAVGRVGAGAGASTGKWRSRLDPGGLGVARGSAGPATVVALAVVNAWGDVISQSGLPVFAPDDETSTPEAGFSRGNTTIAVVLTDARLSKSDCYLLAQSGHTGFARAIHPAHSRYDGDAVVALATGEAGDADLDLLRAVTTDVMATAIREAVAGPQTEAHSPAGDS
jgi:L-aminopeptidase/D-esterase-like protein